MSIATPLFADHTRSFATHRYVYPVISRRSRGLSVGINLNPDKICNFDCVYCCVDRRTPGDRSAIDLEVLRRELTSLLSAVADGSFWSMPPFDQTPEALRRLNDIAFSGDGEPTTAREFPACVAMVAEVRAWLGLDAAKTVIISNATMFAHPAVRAALLSLREQDEVWGKLDAGTDAYYQLIDRSAVPLQRICDHLLALGRARALTIQSLFMRVHGQPPDEAEIAAWVARLVALRDGGAQLRLVQVYTIARWTTETWVTPLDTADLERIADAVRAQGIAAQAFGSAG